jgi:hypothetical protein
MNRASLLAIAFLAAAPAFAQQTGGLPALRTQVDALQATVDALSVQVGGLPGLRAQVTALQATVDALSSAFSQPHQTSDLKGDFATTGSAVCIQSLANTAVNPPLPPAGFNADFSPRPGPVNTLMFTITGLRTFNGDGTGSFHARVVSDTVNGPTNAGDLAGDFTYSVANDGSVTIDNGPLLLTFVAGPLAGQANNITNIPPFTGRVSKDGQTLTTGTENPAVETVTRVDTGIVQQLRVCHRSRVLIRVN